MSEFEDEVSARMQADADAAEAEAEIAKRVAEATADLLQALKMVLPTLERLMYLETCSYGANFSKTRLYRARREYQAVRDAIAKAEGQAT